PPEIAGVVDELPAGVATLVVGAAGAGVEGIAPDGVAPVGVTAVAGDVVAGGVAAVGVTAVGVTAVGVAAVGVAAVGVAAVGVAAVGVAAVGVAAVGVSATGVADVCAALGEAGTAVPCWDCGPAACAVIAVISRTAALHAPATTRSRRPVRTRTLAPIAASTRGEATAATFSPHIPRDCATRANPHRTAALSGRTHVSALSTRLSTEANTCLVITRRHNVA
ncbi:MAG: hypothetical protein WAM30_03225, partial [Candidatus Dormiibacterota bacterium]